MLVLRETASRTRGAGDGDRLRSLQGKKRSRLVENKGRRWARYRALAFPGVTFTALIDGRSMSYTLVDGLMFVRGLGTRPEPYKPWELGDKTNLKIDSVNA